MIDNITCSVAHVERQSTSNSFRSGLLVVKEKEVVEIAGEGKTLKEVGTPAIEDRAVTVVLNLINSSRARAVENASRILLEPASSTPAIPPGANDSEVQARWKVGTQSLEERESSILNLARNAREVPSVELMAKARVGTIGKGGQLDGVENGALEDTTWSRSRRVVLMPVLVGS